MRITCWFAVGILLYDFSATIIPFASNAFVVSIPVYLAFLLYLKKWSFIQYNMLLGFLISTLLVLAGYLTSQRSDGANEARTMAKIADSAEFVVAKVASFGAFRPRHTVYQTSVEQVYVNGSWHQAHVGCKLYVDDTSASVYQYGQTLLIHQHLSPIPPSGNLALFDYKKFLARKGIFFIQYAGDDDIAVASPGKDMLFGHIGKLRGYLNNALAKYVPDEEAREMLKGLLLGDKSGIDQETLQAYKTVGASHVLAISGLHVGILFLLCSWIFGFLKRKKWSAHFFYVLLLTVIWIYAAITGFSPSVNRASIMFSCIIVSQWINRKANIYNTLAVAAFALLMLDPNNLYDVGFQLSFTAVVGIVYFYPRLYGLLYVPNTFLDYFWKMSCVSLSAQLVTLPLVAYYFHQIPLLGLVSNFIVINGVWLVLVLGFALFFCSFLAFMATVLGQMLTWIIHLMNGGIGFVDKIPIGPITNIYLKPSWMFLIIAAFLMLVLFFEYHKTWSLALATVCTVILAGLTGAYYWQCGHQQLLAFYEIPGGISVEKVLGPNVVDSYNLPDPVSKTYAFNVSPAHLVYHIHEKSREGADQKSLDYKLFLVNGKSVLVLNNPIMAKNPGSNMTVDYLVIPKNAASNFQHLPSNLKFRHLVVNAVKSINFPGMGFELVNLKNTGCVVLGK